MTHGPDALDLKIEGSRSAERALERERLRLALRLDSAERALAGMAEALGPGVTRSLTLFAPGVDRVLRGRASQGLFFLCWVAFFACFARAVIQSLDRILPTLELLGLPGATVIWALVGAYAGAAVLQLVCVYDAARPSLDTPSPLIAGLASSVIPGWGQLLNGDRLRAVLFLAGAWAAVGARIATSDAAMQLLNRHVPAVSAWEQQVRTPEVVWVAHWTVPAALWCLAIYDAVASAAFVKKLESS